MTIPYRINGPEEIDADKLLLWPNNPRLKISDFAEVKYTDKQLQDVSNQKKIHKLLSKHEDHDVGTLINSMCKVGFMREKAPIVMKVRGADRYLVLEGNRRLTAIKTILADRSASISKSNRQSLKHIPCWIFEHTSKDVPLKAAISRMVAEAHIKGQRQHSKLQRAHMLYDAYEGFLAEEGKARKFVLDKEVLRETAEFFDFPVKELEGEISIVRLYKQLIETYEYEDIPAKCSERLSWVHKNKGQFESHFLYDPIEMRFDEESLDRYFLAFLAADAAVQNPQSLRRFMNVMRHGETEDIDAIVDEPELLAEIDKAIKDRKSSGRFLTGLEVIEKRLGSLRISDFKNSLDEKNAIRRISLLMEKKLGRLVLDSASPEKKERSKRARFRRPSDIEEAVLLDYSLLSKQVIKVVKARPNSTCPRKSVPTLLLKEWNLKSRGKPREAFCRYVDESIQKMSEEGHLKLYKAKNERVKV